MTKTTLKTLVPKYKIKNMTTTVVLRLATEEDIEVTFPKGIYITDHFNKCFVNIGVT